MVRLEVALVAELISLHRSAFPLWERNDFLPGNHSEMVELMPRIFRPEGPTLGLLATKFGLTAGIFVALTLQLHNKSSVAAASPGG